MLDVTDMDTLPVLTATDAAGVSYVNTPLNDAKCRVSEMVAAVHPTRGGRRGPHILSSAMNPGAVNIWVWHGLRRHGVPREIVHFEYGTSMSPGICWSLDADAERWTFQTFDNRDHNRKLARILHGSLDEHAETLSELNCQGAAICVTMNETDFRGTSKENIRRVRALVADLDGAPLEAVRDCRLRPHIIVETSPGRYHVYWLVEEDFPLAEFQDTQRGVAKAFDGDTAVALLTHRARLPGFFHMKGIPSCPEVSRSRPPSVRYRYDPGRVSAEVKPHKASGSRPILPAGAPVPAAEEFVTRCHAD